MNTASLTDDRIYPNGIHPDEIYPDGVFTDGETSERVSVDRVSALTAQRAQRSSDFQRIETLTNSPEQGFKSRNKLAMMMQD